MNDNVPELSYTFNTQCGKSFIIFFSHTRIVFLSCIAKYQWCLSILDIVKLSWMTVDIKALQYMLKEYSGELVEYYKSHSSLSKMFSVFTTLDIYIIQWAVAFLFQCSILFPPKICLKKK